MAILSMPNTNIKSVRFLLQGNSLELTSPLTRSVQTLELVGSRWLATYELPPMPRATAEVWIAFLTKLNGMSGRFYGGDPAGYTPQGPATGTPVIPAAGLTGIDLPVEGFSVASPLAVGDYVAWDTPSGWRELHKVITVSAGLGVGYGEGGYGEGGYGSGVGLTIAPPIRESPAAGATLIVNSATCVMRLATDDVEWSTDFASLYGIVFSAEESFYTVGAI